MPNGVASGHSAVCCQGNFCGNKSKRQPLTMRRKDGLRIQMRREMEQRFAASRTSP